MNPMENDKLLQSLQERARELQCLYRVKEVVNKGRLDIKDIFEKLVKIIPTGMQYPDLARVRIQYRGEVFLSEDFSESPWSLQSIFKLNEEPVGRIDVFYKNDGTNWRENPFLPEEDTLLGSIADRLENYLFQKELQTTVEQWEKARSDLDQNKKREWIIILELLEKMDSNLFSRICRRMLNHLCWLGIDDAKNILGCLGMKKACDMLNFKADENKPSLKIQFTAQNSFNLRIFNIAADNFSDEEILANIQRWIKEDKIGFLVRVLENMDTSLAEISGAISRYHHTNRSKIEISPYARSNINALFMQRLFTEQLEFIKLARDLIDIDDFYTILQHTIYPNNSHGKLGGKSTGLFIAGQVLKKAGVPVKVPKTWYISSDYMQSFIYYNNLEEVMEQKYKAIEEIRTEYPNLIQVFKNSNFPLDIVNGLSLALDDFGDQPIIVRSSSLLEDRFGTSFSGKYKSLFLANQGTREEKLNALMDAIAEVYASVFGPDPIEYRKERGLLEFHEEMAIILQEVVGEKAGNYYFPAFAGVAFSHNEFRWSPRIKQEDRLLRIVPGLGTRAVDRLNNDYPVLICPEKPTLKVNVSPDETARYSPRDMDVIDLSENSFKTVSVRNMLKECGRNFPEIDKVVSVYDGTRIANRNIFQIDFEKDDLIVTFDPLIQSSPFIKQIKSMLDILKEKMGVPVDLELAYCNGQVYLLQCRPQSSSPDNHPSPIPQDLPEADILFNARRYISNGQVNEITHIVYVKPESYNELKDLETLNRVGEAVGKLNSVLPKRQFILMGPGRWGSRGDIKMGVNVTYSDINNTAMLIEIARQKGNYVPELSFGTHFFQDLVEASIRYLPLYPDNPDNIFQEFFLTRSRNILGKLLPEFSDLSDTVFVLDVPQETDGKILKVLMNGDIDEAVAYFATPDRYAVAKQASRPETAREPQNEDFWRWRLSMAEKIAGAIDAERFGVKAFYVFGSTKNATAGPASDIDIMIHFTGTEEQRMEMLAWLEGWSLCLGQMNYLKTGYKIAHLLDIHVITDEDIERRSSYAVKIGAVTDPARELPLLRKSGS